MSTSSPSMPVSSRLTSLDQFRGYTMLGMLFVNFLGGYKLVCPGIFRHTNDYCSYADTIMPQFFFAVGFAMRLSLGKRIENGGKMPWSRAIRRIIGLAFVAIIWYSIADLSDITNAFRTKPTFQVLGYLFKSPLFQTLLHIAATSLWILPVIISGWKVRLSYAIASGILHVLISWAFNYEWVRTPPSAIDGGPLGFISWSIPALCGTLACDAVRASDTSASIRIAISGVAVMLFGWGLSIGTTLYNVPADKVPAECKYALDAVVPSMDRIRAWDGTLVEPPFVRPPDFKHRQWNYWMMSQHAGSVSYTTFSAGLSLVVYTLFLWLCDGQNLRLGIFRTLGTNSLAAYIFHEIAAWIVVPFFPKSTSSVLFALCGFAIYTLLVYAACRFLEWRGWYLRV